MMVQSALTEIPIRIPSPIRGLVTMRGIDEAPLNSLREAQNVRFDKGVLTKLPGASKFGVALDNPVIGICEVLFLTGTQFILAVTTSSLYYWNYTTEAWVQDATGLAGKVTQQVSWCVLDDAFVFTNGTNFKRWTAPDTLTDQVTTLPSGVTAFKADYITSFGGRLLCLSTTEDGTKYPTRLRYSALNDGQDFAGAGAGYYDFDDNAQPGMNILVLGDYVFAYKERTLFYGRQTGNAANPLSFRTLIEGIGPALAFTTTKRKDKHWFMGWDGAYEISSSAAVSEISSEVRRTLVDALNDGAFGTGWSTVLEAFAEAWIVAAEDSDSYPQNGWIYNYEHSAWTRFLVPGTIQLTTGGASRLLNTFKAWGDSQGTWGSQTEVWGDRTLEEGTPVNLFGSYSGQIYELDASLVNWDDAAINAYFTSQLLALQNEQGEEVAVYLKSVKVWYFKQSASCSLTVAVSLDEGNSFPYTDTITLEAGSGELAVATAHFFLECHAFMIRMSNAVASETFKIRGFTPLVSMGAPPV